MAEVGLARSAAIIVETVLKAVAYPRSSSPQDHTPEANGSKANAPFPPCSITFASTWLGISGCDTPLDQSRMAAALTPFFGSPPAVHNDALLLGGALLRHGAVWGFGLIAGTGSIAVALEVRGGEVTQAARRGGHGYLLGDDGSAWDVGRWAVRVVVDAYDAGEEARADGGGSSKETSTLAALVRAHFDIASTPEVLGKVHELGAGTPIEATNAAKLRVTSLARAVLEAAERGDVLAREAVRRAATPLAMSAVQLVRQMERRGVKRGECGEPSGRAPMLVCGGGCLRQEHYRALVLDICRAEGVTFDEVAVVEDVAGEAALGLVARGER